MRVDKKRRGRVLTERREKRREGENQTEERIEPQSLSQLDANKEDLSREERRREAQRGAERHSDASIRPVRCSVVRVKSG